MRGARAAGVPSGSIPEPCRDSEGAMSDTAAAPRECQADDRSHLRFRRGGRHAHRREDRRLPGDRLGGPALDPHRLAPRRGRLRRQSPGRAPGAGAGRPRAPFRPRQGGGAGRARPVGLHRGLRRVPHLRSRPPAVRYSAGAQRNHRDRGHGALGGAHPRAPALPALRRARDPLARHQGRRTPLPGRPHGERKRDARHSSSVWSSAGTSSIPSSPS